MSQLTPDQLQGRGRRLCSWRHLLHRPLSRSQPKCHWQRWSWRHCPAWAPLQDVEETAKPHYHHHHHHLLLLEIRTSEGTQQNGLLHIKTETQFPASQSPADAGEASNLPRKARHRNPLGQRGSNSHKVAATRLFIWENFSTNDFEGLGSTNCLFIRTRNLFRRIGGLRLLKVLHRDREMVVGRCWLSRNDREVINHDPFPDTTTWKRLMPQDAMLWS